MPRRKSGSNGYSAFEVEVSGRLGSIETNLQEHGRRIGGVEGSISKLDLKLDGFQEVLNTHAKEEYVRFDSLEGAINEVKGGLAGVSSQMGNPRVSLKTLGGILAAVLGAMATITLLADYLLHP